ncbi:ribokinase [Shinella daejeonensis]|uniref:ribokinase n=1 Tax=Shinella daejeonensis TaxID=659017 RepID=UPI0020C79B67|nr:ribokinase [Shinella daejeonensis]MCP8894682.1 ribokinase [Shinella daejeonensis]
MKYTSPFDVVVVGSAHMDVIVHMSRRPVSGETVAARSWLLQVGGKGANQALQASTQGARVAMVGRIGADQFGTIIADGLAAAGVDTGHLTVDAGNSSGMGIAMIGADGVPEGITVGGVNGMIGSADIDGAESIFAGAHCLLLQQEIAPQANIAAAHMARRHGVRVILNAAPASPLDPALNGNIDIIVVNEIEAAMMSGLADVTDVATAVAAAERLSHSVPTVLVTLGGNGVVVLQQRAAPVHIPGHAVAVVDALGAGDSFIGGLAARLSRGDDMISATRYANATGALAVSQPGLTGDHLAPERVLAFLAAARENGH